MRVCFLLLVVGNIYVWHYTTTRADSYHHIYFLDVGQGDSIFIRTAADFRILIDAGTTNSAASELGRILPAWDRQIDLVIATHPHADHIGGLADVIDQYRVDKFWWNGAAYESQTHATLLADLAAANIPTEVTSHQTLLPLPDGSATTSYCRSAASSHNLFTSRAFTAAHSPLMTPAVGDVTRPASASSMRLQNASASSKEGLKRFCRSVESESPKKGSEPFFATDPSDRNQRKRALTPFRA